jgi:superoxide dismutase, Cu-Zn family
MRGFEHGSRVPLRLIAVSTTFGLGLVCAALMASASAQEIPRVFITVAPATLAAPDATTHLPLEIGPPGVVVQNSFLRVRGLPPSAALSDGYAVTAGNWSVPLAAARSLAVILPAEAEGRAEIAIDVVNVDGNVLAQARTVLVIASGSEDLDSPRPVETRPVETRPAETRPVEARPVEARPVETRPVETRPVETATIARPDLDPSPFAAIQRGFEVFLARTPRSDATALTPDQRSDMFRQFLTWAQNPVQVDVNVRLTALKGTGDLIGTVTVGNTEITVAGRREAALLIKPNLKGLRPGSYAFHVHEHANCDSAVKDREHVPGLGAGQPLWLSGTGAGQLAGPAFASYLGKLPNLEVDGNGTATKPVVAARLTLADVAHRSLMINASDEANSPRMACGRLN